MKFLKALGGLLCAIGCVVALAGILATAAPMIDNDQVRGVIDSFSMQSDNSITNAVNAAATFCLSQNYLVFGLGIVMLLIGGLMRTGAERALYATHTDAPETGEATPAADQNEPTQPAATDREPLQSAATESKPPKPAVSDREPPQKYPAGQRAIPRIEHNTHTEDSSVPAEDVQTPIVMHDSITEQLIASILEKTPAANANVNPEAETQIENKTQALFETQPEEELAPSQADIHTPDGFTKEHGESQPEPPAAEPEPLFPQTQFREPESQAAVSEPHIPQTQFSEPEPAILRAAETKSTTPQTAEPEPSMLWPTVPEPKPRQSAKPEPVISPESRSLDTLLTAKPLTDPQGVQPEAPIHAEWSYHPPVLETQPDKPATQRSVSDARTDWETNDNGDERVIIATRKTATPSAAETTNEPINTVDRDAAPAQSALFRETLAHPAVPTRFHTPDAAPATGGREPDMEQRQAPEPRPTAEPQPAAVPQPKAETQPTPEPQPAVTPQTTEAPQTNARAPLARLVSQQGRPRIVTTLPNLRLDGDELTTDHDVLNNEPPKSGTDSPAAPEPNRPRIVSTMGKRNP